MQQDAVLSSVLAGPAEWRCWQTGIELKYADTTLIRIRELLGYLRYSPDYRKMRSVLGAHVNFFNSSYNLTSSHSTNSKQAPFF